jgi:hypothetical protein
MPQNPSGLSTSDYTAIRLTVRDRTARDAVVHPASQHLDIAFTGEIRRNRETHAISHQALSLSQMILGSSNKYQLRAKLGQAHGVLARVRSRLR